MINNTYHFSVHAYFKENAPVKAIEKELEIKCYKTTTLEESKGQNKLAKIWYKTNNFDDADTAQGLNTFIQKFEHKLAILKKYCEKYEGSITLCLYFDNIGQKPYISLEPDSINILSKYNVKFDVDFKL